MDSNIIPVLFVTANVGSIFEEPAVMLKQWTDEFLSTVIDLSPKFIALHCQEVGGKNYEKSMKYVEQFLRLLIASEQLQQFDRVRIYIDEDYSSAENFTALGNIYFIHETLTNISVWDFKNQEFIQINGKEINTGNIEGVPTKEKSKFPQDFFPECKWSRKGYLRTRWSIRGTIFDLINIHLFHDASNFVAMETYPSVYSRTRRRALEHTLKLFHTDHTNGAVPFFVFGDFNFRTDTEAVVKKLAEGLTETKVQHHHNQNNNNKSKTNITSASPEYVKLQYYNASDLVLTVGKKEFNHTDHQNIFLNKDLGSWLKSYDHEPESFSQHLHEYPVTFPPSYPYEEKISAANSYMRTRCPAWCDRVLLSHSAKTLVEESQSVLYNLIGRYTCMGDHKPVYLRLGLRADSGIVNCSAHSHVDGYVCENCYDWRHYASTIQINVTDMCDDFNDRLAHNNQRPFSNGDDVVVVDRTLLHEPITREMLSHDPYTPESIESHSPCNIPAHKIDSMLSPGVLKSRLEHILLTDAGVDDDDDDGDDENTSKIPSKSNNDEQSVRYERTRTQSQSLGYSTAKTAQIRMRCMSDSSKQSKRSNSKFKLISSNSVHSMHRLQSHHSSSDEDWFELDNDEDDDDDLKKTVREDDVFVQTNDDDKNIRLQKRSRKKQRRTKILCCSIA